MHPQNIFSEVLLLLLIGLILVIRDRGSAESSTNYDPLLGGTLIILSLVRYCEFLSQFEESQIRARFIVWFMWFLPILVLAWLLYHNRRIDLIVILVVGLIMLIGATIALLAGEGGYNIIPSTPQTVGISNGVFIWFRIDGRQLFMPFSYYILLTVALIYLTCLYGCDPTYWIFAGITTIGFLIGAILIPQVVKQPLATLGSLSTLVMLGVGVAAIFMAPG